MSEKVIESVPTWVRLGTGFVRCLPAGRYRAIERLCRIFCRRQPATFRMSMPRSLGGHQFICDLRDSIAREVCFTGRYEPQETAVVQAVLKPGMTFVDVGANWGYFTLLAAHLVGPAGCVLSLEPDPRLHRMLQTNLTMNRLGPVKTFAVAAGASDGWLTLAGFEESKGNFGLSRVVGPLSFPSSSLGTRGGQTSEVSETSEVLSEQGVEWFRVSARPLDDVLARAGVDNVDLMKMDIEGAEGLALQGMRQYLSQQRIRRLMLELHPKQLAEHGQVASDLIRQLRHFAYVGWRIDHSPRANRRTAYQRRISLREILRPFEEDRDLDNWPHLLWELPGLESPW
jgi:FkbM family methyltransferase